MRRGIDVVFVAEPTAWHIDPWLTVCASAPAVSSVTLADGSGALAERARELLGQKLRGTVSSVEAALEAAPESRLGIVTLEPWRTPPACAQLLNAGRHVIYEKPGAATPDDARALAALARERRRHLMIAFANRARPHLRWVRQAVADGMLGDIWSVDLRCVVRDRLVHGHREHGGGWLFSPRRGGGFLPFLGCHMIDAATWLTGRPFEAVAGFAGTVHDYPLEVEDTAAFAFRLGGGVFGSFLGGYNSPQAESYAIALYGSDGWIETDLVATAPVRCLARRGAGGSMRQWTEEIAPLPAGRDAYAAFADACLAAVLGDAPPPVEPEDGARMLEVAAAVNAASRSGSSQATPAGRRAAGATP